MGTKDLGDLDAGKLKTITTGLKEGEVAGLEKIAASVGVTRNALMRYILRRFLVDYQAGKVEVEVEKKMTTTLRLP